MPERGHAHWTSQNIAGLIVNDHGGVNCLHIMIETHGTAVVGSVLVEGTIVAGGQFAHVEPIEVHDRV